MSQVLVEQNPSPMKLEVMNVEDWPTCVDKVGETESSVDGAETSYIIRGQAVITTPDGLSVDVGEGDLLNILPGTRCTWNITKEIERHYSKG